MNISEKDKLTNEEFLKEAELIDADDCIIEYTKGDLWEIIISQTRGRIFFTNKKVIFAGGLMNSSTVAISYSDIIEIKPCIIFPFLPTGIKITYTNPKNGKTSKCTLSVLGRKNWIDYLSEKTNS